MGSPSYSTITESPIESLSTFADAVYYRQSVWLSKSGSTFSLARVVRLESYVYELQKSMESF